MNSLKLAKNKNISYSIRNHKETSDKKRAPRMKVKTVRDEFPELNPHNERKPGPAHLRARTPGNGGHGQGTVTKGRRAGHTDYHHGVTRTKRSDETIISPLEEIYIYTFTFIHGALAYCFCAFSCNVSSTYSMSFLCMVMQRNKTGFLP